MDPITPTDIRYIKLGPANAWFQVCRAADRIDFGFPDIPHELAAAGDWDAVEDRFRQNGTSSRKIRDFTREVREFYTQDQKCLWITFADGHLWWTFAEPEVIWAEDDVEGGVRYRRTIGSWCNTDIHGEPLRQSDLSTRLTQVAAYRQTLCSVGEGDYAIRRINAVIDPLIARAHAAQDEMTAVTAELIAGLHWKDFEVLVDLIFARTGWQRVSELGGPQKDTDLILEQPATGERAFVQVKSKANAATFQASRAAYNDDGSYNRMFFVCHSPVGTIPSTDDPAINYWAGPTLAELTANTGLTNWVLKHIA
jgi:hypothetical protein